MLLSNIKQVLYVLIDGYYYPLRFYLEGNGGLTIKELYEFGYANVDFKNMRTIHGIFPVPYIEDKPLVEETLPYEKRIIENAPDNSLIQEASTYLNFLPQAEVVEYMTYMGKLLQPAATEEPLEAASWEDAPSKEDANSTSLQEPGANVYNNVGNFLTLKGSDAIYGELVEVELPEEGYIDIVELSPDELFKQEELIKACKNDIAKLHAFNPRIRKHTRPFGTYMSNLSLEQFKRCLAYIENKVKSEAVDTIGKEILNNLGKDAQVDINALISNFTGEYGDLLYELVKYEVLDTSPNGLYNNKYLLLYLIELELTLQGKTAEEIETFTLILLTTLCCNSRQLDLNEGSGDDDDDTSLSDNSLRSLNSNLNDIGTINETDSTTFTSLNYLKWLIQDCFSKNSIYFVEELNQFSNLTTSQKCCVSALYNVPVTLKSHVQDILKLDILEFSFLAYSTKITFCGMDVSPHVLGFTISNYMDALAGGDIVTQMSLGAEDTVAIEDLGISQETAAITDIEYYNEVFNKYFVKNVALGDRAKIHNYTLIEDPREYTYTAERAVILAYDEDGKSKKEAFGLIVVCASKDGKGMKNIFLPKYSTIYKTFDELNVTISIAGEDKTIRASKFAISGGKTIYSMNNLLQDVIIAGKTKKASYLEIMPVAKTLRKDTFSNIKLFINYYKEYRARKGQPMDIKLNGVIQNDIENLIGVLKLCK